MVEFTDNSTPCSMFAISCVTDLTNTREGERLVVMRKFMKDGLGDAIRIIDEFCFPDYARVGLIVVVEAASLSIVEQAIGFCKGVFTTRVDPVVMRSPCASARSEGRYAIVALNVSAANAAVPATDGSHGPDDADVRLWIDFDGDAPYRSLVVVDTPTFGTAHRLGRGFFPGVVAETVNGHSLAALFAAKTAPVMETEVSLAAAPLMREASSVANASIFNLAPAQGYANYRDGLYWQTDSLSPFDASMALQIVAPESSAAISARTYVWPKNPDYNRLPYFKVVYSNANSFHSEWSYYPYPEGNWVVPYGSVPAIDGTQFAFLANGGLSGFSTRSPLSLWLDALMRSDQYAKPWPEDSYIKGMKRAYEYIVSQLPGKVPPKMGTLKQIGPIVIIDYPGDADFSRDDFKAVKDHLILEVGYFATADDWFSINGIIDAINRGIAIMSTNDLIEAAEYMQIPVQTTDIMMILDAIFESIIAVIAVIPPAGPAIAAVLQVGWTITKAALAPGVTSSPINAAIANIADQLNNVLINMETAAQTQQNILYGNWGKLEEFSLGVATGIISERMLLGSTGQGGPEDAADDALDNGPTRVNQRVQAAAATAWLRYCYQRLFVAVHQVQVTMSLLNQQPANPWNPDSGNYHFTWTVPSVYPDSKGNPVNGFLVFDATTDAPVVVMQQLFGASSRLNTDPVEFFVGLNGWYPAQYTYYAGYQGISMNRPKIPATQIGLPAWGVMFQQHS